MYMYLSIGCVYLKSILIDRSIIIVLFCPLPPSSLPPSLSPSLPPPSLSLPPSLPS